MLSTKKPYSVIKGSIMRHLISLWPTTTIAWDQCKTILRPVILQWRRELAQFWKLQNAISEIASTGCLSKEEFKKSWRLEMKEQKFLSKGKQIQKSATRSKSENYQIILEPRLVQLKESPLKFLLYFLSYWVV